MRITVSTDGVLERVTTGLEKLSAREAQRVMSMALNRSAGKGATLTRRAAARTTGMPCGRVIKVTKITRASPGQLEYRMEAEDGYTSIKDFGSRQTRKGVTSRPWGIRRTFPGTFGPTIVKLGQHTFTRESEARLPIKRLSGPAIPKELERGESASQWRAILPRLDREILREIDRLLTVARVSRHLQQAIAR